MSSEKSKPKGESGPIAIGANGSHWDIAKLPNGKAERERHVADVIANASSHAVSGESDPSWMPIEIAAQNSEADLDFTINTAAGKKLMELVEFAPISEFGRSFSDAPMSVEPKAKAKLALDRVNAKSAKQGGPDRVLVIHASEHAFQLDIFTIEIMRRALNRDPPGFDRVYFVSVDNLLQGPLSEIYPAAPFGRVGEMSDDELEKCNVTIPHPSDLIGGQEPPQA